MAVTHTWSVVNMERNTSDGGVTTVHWNCVGVDGEATATAYGTTSHQPDASAADFVAYNDLTESAVLEWVWAGLVRADVEQAVTDKINAELNPTSTDGVPW